MPYSQPPDHPITADEAVAAVRTFIDERSAAGVLAANAFTEVDLAEGVLTATWDEAAIGKEQSDRLLELNPFEDFAELIGTPLAFDNEQGRQIRQHVHRVSVIGPFGVGGLTSHQLYKIGTGWDPDDEAP